jgi:hypothetical protein
MAMENLLTRVATTIGARQGENVATASLHFLLERDAGARRAVVALVSHKSGSPLPEDLVFRTQAGSADAGIADMAATRPGHASERLIIEAKVNANLSAGQAAKYLRRLGMDGVLVLLAPDFRLRPLFAAACAECGLEAEGTALVARSAQGKTIAAVSWAEAMAAIRSALVDPALHGDVTQVEGLLDHLERRTFVPFAPEHLSRDMARLHASYDQLVVEVLAAMKAGNAEGVKIYGRQAGGDGYFGGGLKLGQHVVWFGRHTGRWVLHELAGTPYWLHFSRMPDALAEQLRQTVNSRAGKERCFGNPAQYVAVWPLVGVDKEVVVRDLVRQIADIRERVRGLPVSAVDAAAEPDNPQAAVVPDAP